MPVDASELRFLYLQELLTEEQIAVRLGVSSMTIRRARRRWDVQTISFRQRRERKMGYSGPSLDDLDRSQLQALIAATSIACVAKQYGVEKPAIRNRMKAWGIPARTKREQYTLSLALSKVQTEVVLGTLMGDGHMLERGVLKISHCPEQLGYLEYLHEILGSELARPIAYSEKVMPKSGNVVGTYSFYTRPHVWFRELRQQFYPEGKRILPKGILEELSARSLAIFYCDDGHLSEDKYPSFAVGDLTLDDVARFRGILETRFGLETTLCRLETTCKIVSIRARACERFFEIVAPHIVSCLRYKLPPRIR